MGEAKSNNGIIDHGQLPHAVVASIGGGGGRLEGELVTAAVAVGAGEAGGSASGATATGEQRQVNGSSEGLAKPPRAEVARWIKRRTGSKPPQELDQEAAKAAEAERRAERARDFEAAARRSDAERAAEREAAVGAERAHLAGEGVRHQVDVGCSYLDRTEAVYASLVDGGRLGLCRANLTDNDALGLYSSFFSEVRPCRPLVHALFLLSLSRLLSLYFIYLFVFFRDH